MTKSKRREAHAPSELQALLAYDPGTGVLTWKRRSGNPAFNARAAGKAAGHAKSDKNTSYINIAVEGKFYKGHRVAWAIHYGTWPDHEIDHIDGDGLNNRITNLRDVPSAINKRNARMRSDNSTGYTGVYRTRHGRWQASLRINGRQIHIGHYRTAEDAADARRAAQNEHGFTRRHGVACKGVG